MKSYGNLKVSAHYLTIQNLGIFKNVWRFLLQFLLKHTIQKVDV